MSEITQEVIDIINKAKRDSERLERIEVSRHTDKDFIYLWLNPLLYKEFNTFNEVKDYLKQYMKQRFGMAPAKFDPIATRFIGIAENTKACEPRIILISDKLDEATRMKAVDILTDNRPIGEITQVYYY